MDFTNAKGIIPNHLQHAFTVGTHAYVEGNYGAWWADTQLLKKAIKALGLKREGIEFSWLVGAFYG